MKKYIILVIVMLGTFINAQALNIKSLGYTSGELENIEFKTREDTDKLYFMYGKDIYAMGENDRYQVYIRAVAKPDIDDFGIKADVTRAAVDMLRNKDSNKYSYILGKDYKWITVNYTQENVNISEYYLAWKDLFITITFQAKGDPFTKDEIRVFDKYVEGSKVDGTGKAEVSHVNPNGIDYFKKPKKKNYLIMIIICVSAIVLTYYLTRKKK